MIGERFGRLIVQGETMQKQHGSVVYVCVCDCGGSCLRSGRTLKFAAAHGINAGCGCTALEQRRRIAKSRTHKQGEFA